MSRLSIITSLLKNANVTEKVQVQNRVEHVKARCDYKSRNEILEIPRESSKKIKLLKTQNRRLEEFMENMVSVGPNSNNELKDVYGIGKGLHDNCTKLKNSICQWETVNLQDLKT